MSKTILVFDFGATSVRAMFCKHEGGRLSLEEIHRFENRPLTEGGHLRWDIDELWEQMKIAISFGVFNGGFDAISIDAWGADFGLLGQNGELLEKPVCYLDERTNGMPEEVYEKFPPEQLFAKSGIQPICTNTIFQLNYLAQHEKNSIFRAERLLMMADLFAYFLTGKVRSEFTAAITTQLIDHKAKGWNLKLIEGMELPKRLFCSLIRPGEVYGTLKQELCEEFRIEPVPVYACCSHDISSVALAVPSSDEYFAFVNCGTQTFLGTELKRPLVTEDAMKLGFTNAGGYGGSSVLLKNITQLQFIKEIKHYYEKQGNEYSSSELEKMAEEAAPFASLIDINDASFASPDDMPLKIQEYCRRTGQPVPETAGEMMRCICQSLACEFAVTLKKAEALTDYKYKNIHMTGDTSELLCKLTASAAGVPAVAGPVEATALGNGSCTLVACGEIESIAKARELIIASGLTTTYEPTEREKWAPVLERYTRLVNKE